MRRARLIKARAAGCALAVLVILHFLDWKIFNSHGTSPTSRPQQTEIINKGRGKNVNKNLTFVFDDKKRQEIEKFMEYLKPVKFDEMPWNTPFDLDLRVIVITFDRASSVERLLTSLNNANYLGDKVAIDVWIDRSKSGVIHEETYKKVKTVFVQTW
ncbi:uncharacterized protein LOC117315522 [Pecten maximus]|uniref:uncharacterized protein LOC117315522 n=1 Tax=Pecten maximus TaxID=6579 RepID=UPI001458BC9E|nr:uncharacterized protein LOC117315522 [Pecten maximus]